MSNLLVTAATDLTKREKSTVVAATGLVFQHLNTLSIEKRISKVLESHKGGVWGKLTELGLGYPVLRSTNMRGSRVDTDDPAWCDVSDDKVQRFRLQTGDILVTKSSGSSDLVGKAAIFFEPDDGNTYLFSNFTLCLRPDTQQVVPEYLAWFLRSPQSLSWRYESQQTTVGLRNLKTKDFLAQTLPVPSLDLQSKIILYLDAVEAGDESAHTIPLPPLAEQQRIVARIDDLAARIEEAKGLRAGAMAEVEAVMGAEVEEIFRAGRENDWIQITIGELVNEVRYGTSVKAYADPIGLPVLRMGNIQDGKLNITDLKYLELTQIEIEKLKLKYGDILVNRTNSAELVGKCAVFDLEDDFVYASYIIRLRLNPELADPYLVARYINSPAGRAYMFAERKQMTGQANINSKKLRALPISLPSLTDQRRIVAYLDDLQAKVDAVKRLQVETQAELDALLPSVLDRAFRGEL